jgi:large subunit ribosomal protein L4
VIAGFVEGDVPSTKAALAALGAVTDRDNVLVVAARGDEITVKSLRNVPQVHLIAADQLNTYDVLCSDDVVFTRSALEVFLDGRTVVVTSGGGDDGSADERRTDETSAVSTTSTEKTAKSAAAKKTATAKKATAKKTVAKKTVAKKTVAKNAVAKKATAKKATAKKATATEEDSK